MPSPDLVPPLPSALSAGDGNLGDSAAAAALDAAALARLAELDPGGEGRLVERVLKTFQSSAAKLQVQLAAARASGDRDAIRLVAHTLKSSSGYVGALELARRCAELEAACARPDAGDLTPQIEGMVHALDTGLAAVSRRLATAS